MSGQAILDRLDAMERALQAKGFPPMSDWWRATVERLYRSGKRQLVVRVGRRGGKSSTLCRLAVLEMLYGDHKIPPGDIGLVGLVSVSRAESSKRLRTISAILDALGVKYTPLREGDGFELLGRNRGCQCFTATVAGVSGPTLIFVLCDEVSKWADKDTGANPASEVLASLRPTMATMPNAKIVLSSSPLSKVDAHYEAFERGETDHQAVAFAETWIANPTVTREQTKILEPDERLWLREYAAIPSAAASGAFDPEAVARAFEHNLTDRYSCNRKVIVVDPSNLRCDTWAWGVCGWAFDETDKYYRLPGGEHFLAYDWACGYYKVEDPNWMPTKPVFRFFEIDGIEGGFWTQESAWDIAERLKRLGQRHDTCEVRGDSHGGVPLDAVLGKVGLHYKFYHWTNPSKREAVDHLRRLFADGAIALPPHEELRKQLLSFEERYTASGNVVYAGRGSTHDDYVALLLTAAMADLNPEDVNAFTDSPYHFHVTPKMIRKPFFQ